MKPENQANYYHLQEITRLLKLQGSGIKLPLIILVAGFVFLFVLAVPAQSALMVWFGAWFVVGPIIYFMLRREPRVPDAVLTLVSRYKPNNGASAKEFEAFQKGFRESERREQVIQWCSREQGYLLAEELGESGRLAFLSRDLSSEK